MTSARGALGSLARALFSQSVYEVKTQPPEAAPAPDRLFLSHEELHRLRELFYAGEFDALNEALADMQADSEKDVSRDGVNAFGMLVLPGHERQLEAWIAHDPSHFAPYLARAALNHSRGWDARVGVTDGEAPRTELVRAEDCFDKVADDVEAALDRNPRLLFAHILRISTRTAVGDRPGAKAAYEEARRLFPDSHTLHSQMMWASLPRWGGSYPEMERVASDAVAGSKRSELMSLFGEVYADQASVARAAGRYEQSLELYSRAIEYGPEPEFFQGRAQTLIKMKNYDRALREIDRAIELQPDYSWSYLLRAQINLNKRKTEDAIRDIELADDLSPRRHKVNQVRGWAAVWLVNRGIEVGKASPRREIAKDEAALRVKPDDAHAYYRRGVAYERLGQKTRAIEDARRAIECDAHHFEAYRFLDYLLVADRKYDEVIQYWTAFLKLEPTNAKAYLERAGTYRLKGDASRFRADLRRSAELGNEQARELLGRLPEAEKP